MEITNLTKRFGSRLAVGGINLKANPGEIYGFLGTNGAGKTTTIRMLLGILQPDAGEVKICGRKVRKGDRSARHLVGAVAEIQYMYNDVTCREYLKFFAQLYDVENADLRVDQMLDEVALSDRRDDIAVTLSKGLQQKLGLARALLHNPPVLILDEPISGLDPHGIREFREIICRERDRGRLVFFSSHVLSEVELTADRIGIMRQGNLVFEDTIDGTMSKYESLEHAFISVTGEAGGAVS